MTVDALVRKSGGVGFGVLRVARLRYFAAVPAHRSKASAGRPTSGLPRTEPQNPLFQDRTLRLLPDGS